MPVMTNRIIPVPARASFRDGIFDISPQTLISPDEASGKRANQLIEFLSPALGYRLQLSSEHSHGNRISLHIDGTAKNLGEEGYRIEITPERCQLIAAHSTGLFWAIQTFRQLLPAEIFSSAATNGVFWQIPCGTIEDLPRFTWRGLMLDCARHFMPVEFIYQWIDLLSLHKMNVFHWHLTEDQGWRIEIKKYPKLTEIGAWRENTLIGHALPRREHYEYDNKSHGGFYSQAQIRQIVKYAAERNVTIVPEIEMPGHSQAAIAAYPELGNTGEQLEVWNHWGICANILNANESTIRFYQDVLDEVMDLFPSKFIHVGGDEAIKDQWKTSSRAQARMRELGLTNEEELQSWFIRQMDQFLASRGRRLVGWDEILEGGLAPGATVMSWRGEAGGIAAARAGHDVVMAPQSHVYFDHYQTTDHQAEPLAIGGCTTLEKVYEYEPVPAELNSIEASHVLGAQGQLWTEYVPTPAHAQWMAYPRACALAEVLWSTRGPRDFSDFSSRLKPHLQRLKYLNVNYRPPEGISI